VKILSRPGGNVTGIVARWLELVAKQVELLVEAFPERRRLGVFWDELSADQFAAAKHEANARQLELRALKLENPPYDFAAAFRTLSQDGVQMLLFPVFHGTTRRLHDLPSSIGCRASSSSSISLRPGASCHSGWISSR
jgi:hypothetical protein